MHVCLFFLIKHFPYPELNLTLICPIVHLIVSRMSTMVMALSRPSTKTPVFFTCHYIATMTGTSSQAVEHLTKCDQPPVCFSAFLTSCLSECRLNKLNCMCVYAFLGGQRSRGRLQCKHGFYWRTGSSHG